MQNRQVFNVMLTGQQFVRQDYQQGLAGRLAEDDLEAEDVYKRQVPVSPSLLRAAVVPG